jgi:hypothetical protein
VCSMGKSPSHPSPTPSSAPRMLTTHPGAPEIRQHPRLLLLRRQSLHLARSLRHLVENLRSRPTHRLRKPRILGAARSRLPTRLRLLRRQRLRARVQGQQLVAPGLPGLRQRRQQRELGARRVPGPSHQRERQPGGYGAAVCYGW